MPPARPLTISTNLWNPAPVVKLRCQTPEALRLRHSSQGMNQSQRLLSCFLFITLVCSDWLLRWHSCPIRGELWNGCCGGKLRNPVEEFWVRVTVYNSLAIQHFLVLLYIILCITDYLFLYKFHQFALFFFLNAADDMGLGKTLTMISLILTNKDNKKGEDDKQEAKKPEKWISKTGNCKIIYPLFFVKGDKV